MAKLQCFQEFILNMMSSSISTFIQVGANDGKQSDYLYPHIIKRNLTGIFIEPHPKYAEMIRKLHAGNERVCVEETGISSVESEGDLYYLKEVPDDKEWARGIASFNKEHLHTQGFTQGIDSVRVRMQPLNNIVKKYKHYSPDLLIVDTEGYEIEVFLSCDFTIFKPKFIIVETSTIKEKGFKELSSIIGDEYLGYYDNRDSIFFRNN